MYFYVKTAVLSTYLSLLKDFTDDCPRLTSSYSFHIYVSKSTFAPFYQDIRYLTELFVKTAQFCSRGLGVETHLIGQ